MRVYLIRHGQAGTRLNYDALSDLGQTQSRRLGEYLAAQKVAFRAIYSGALRRQQETAAAVVEAFGRAGVPAPGTITAPEWNEFDLYAVYQALAPRLSAEDPQFAADLAAMAAALRDDPAARRGVSPGDLRCDIAVLRAWAEGRFEHGSETFAAFRERIAGCLGMFSKYGPGEAVAVFTSATPIAVWVGMAMGVLDGTLLRLAGVAYNSGITTLRVRERDLTLFSFNNVPHLPEPGLRTFR